MLPGHRSPPALDEFGCLLAGARILAVLSRALVSRLSHSIRFLTVNERQIGGIEFIAIARAL